MLTCLASLVFAGCGTLGGRGLFRADRIAEHSKRSRRHGEGSRAWTGGSRPSRVHAYTSPGQLPELRDQRGNPLPLRHTGVHASLRGHIAAVKIRQRFHNASDRPIEVVYTFPLPENSAVSDMRMTVGDREIVAEIMRRSEARQTFETARSQGHTASLLEQERPNIFTQSVTNIAPGEDIDVEIRYLQTLTYDAGEYEFVFPMVVGPRFGAGTKAGDLAKISPPVAGRGVRTGHDIDIEVDIQAGSPIVSWTVPTHHIEAEPDGGNLQVALSPAEWLPNRDFILRYRVASSAAKASVFVGEPDAQGQGHYLMVVHPPDTDVDATVGRREVVFVVDRSGSMGGVPLALAKQTVRELMAKLRPVDTFNVVGFASGTSRLWDAPRPANATNLVTALGFLGEMYGGGGTQMDDAVVASLSDDVAPGFNRYVLFLTDGFIGNETAIFEGAEDLVDRQADRGHVAKVFGIGIGSSPNRHLIEGLSRAGGGVPRNISNREEPARVVNAVMHDIDHPALTALTIPRDGPLADEHYPAELPDLFVSQPVVVMGRYHGDVGSSVTLRAHRNGQPLSLTVPVHRIDGADRLLSTLWARAKVDQLDTQLWHAHDPAVVEQITLLGLEHRLVTAYTSFVAVDRTRVVSDGNPDRIEQPVDAPEGVDAEAAGARQFDLAGAVAPLPSIPPSASAASSAPTNTNTGTTYNSASSSGGEFKRVISVRAQPVRQNASAGRTITMEEIRQIPVSGASSRDFTAVVETSATASRDSVGISLAGATGAESKYTVEGATVNNPAFGTVGATIVQEFIEQVEVIESGYEAEYGGASGGQVIVRRSSGTNRLRGVARFTFTPRLAAPRFIVATDNAVRTTETPDYVMQGVLAASGPIIKDRLFWSAGVSITGSRATLAQAFHHRVDRDGSGGYEGCPLLNGAFDCAPGQGHIATRRFAEQSFRTRGIGVSYQLGLDWYLNPRHRVGLTAQGSPSFSRRSYRQAPRGPFDPNLVTDPLGGSSLVANGVVNDHFGWDRNDVLLTAMTYRGRLADDRIELDANLAYSRFSDQTAWRLDDPSQRERPAIQYTDTEGSSLFERLDEDGSLGLVPGVAEACNGPNTSGMACPVRQWMSGGLGQYGRDRNQRAQADLALTHFFTAGGSHQVKYGVNFEHLVRRTESRYSGSNDSDFYDRCAQQGLGDQPEGAGGEWCFDRANGGYDISNALRVDNHRYVRVDLDNPDLRTTFGYGRVRKEDQQLRAIATPDGAGIRAPYYDETLHTTNYGLFLQDRWALLSNLYLSAGLRWELQDMRDVLQRRAIFIRDNVAPRVSIVYDWTDEGRSRLFANYGMFFNPLPTQLSSRVFGGLVDVRRTYREQDCSGRRISIRGETFSLEENGVPSEFCTDVAASTSQLTEGAVVPRLKGQYNHHFQLGYEHEVIEDLVVGTHWQHTQLGRAVEDVSTNGGFDHIIANPGEAVATEDIERQRAECAELGGRIDGLDVDDPERANLARQLQRCETLVDAFSRVGGMFDRPSRSFDALTFQVRKRFARGWLFTASYSYSRLRGNYDGFVDPITGAINLGSSVQYDTPELVRNSFGPLSFDTPHRVKLDGFYMFDLRESGRLTVGTSFRRASGYPISLRGGHTLYGGAPIYVLPRGMGGRIDPNHMWNASLAYAYPLPGNLEIEASFRILNLTNAKATVRVDEVYSYQNTRAVAGGDMQDLKHTKIQSAADPNSFYQRTIIAKQGNYGVETSFQVPLSASFELQLRF